MLSKDQKSDIKDIELFKRVQQSLIRTARPYLEAVLAINPNQPIEEVISEIHYDLKKNQPDYIQALEKLQQRYKNLPLITQQILHQTCPHLFL